MQPPRTSLPVPDAATLAELREFVTLASAIPFGVPEAWLESLRRLDALGPRALPALDALLAALEQAQAERDEWKGRADATIGFMADVAAERDELLADAPAPVKHFRHRAVTAEAERDAALAHIEQLEAALSRAADALHDAAWVMDGAPPSPPLPAPITLVLPQTVRVEAESRAALAGGSGSGEQPSSTN